MNLWPFYFVLRGACCVTEELARPCIILPHASCPIVACVIRPRIR